MTRIGYALSLLVLMLLMCYVGPATRVHAQDQQDELSSLVAKLKDPNAAVRRNTAERLDEFARNDPRVVLPLISALADADPAVRKFAAIALGSARDPRAVTPLLVLLKDGNQNIRIAVVEALGQIGSPRASPALLNALRTDAAVRPVALAALWHIGDDASLRAIIDLTRTGQLKDLCTPAAALGQLGDDAAVATLLSILHQPNHPQRYYAVMALGDLQEPAAVDDLLPLLDLEDAKLFDEPLVIIEALGAIGDPRASEPVARHIGESLTQPFAARALGRFATPQAVEVLSAFILMTGDDAPDQADVHETIEALGRMRDPRALPALMQALAACGEEDAYRRGLLIQALGRIGDARAVDILLPFVANGAREQRCVAIDALRQIAAPKAVPALAPLLADADLQIRSEAAVALASIPDAAAMQMLLPAFRKDPVAYQFKPDWGLSRMYQLLARNHALTTADFASLLENNFTGYDLFLALDQAGVTDPLLLQVMISQIAQGAGWQEEIYDDAFRPYGEAGVTALLEVVRKRQGNGMAERILGRLGDARAVEVIRNARGLERMDMLIPLGRLKAPEVFEPAMARLRQPITDVNDEYHCQQAIEALGALGDPRAVEAIIAHLRHPQGILPGTRIAAARALGEIGDAKAAEALLAALDTDDTFDFREVVRALGKLPPDERITGVLIETLFDARDDLFSYGARRAAAVTALATNTDPRVIPALITALRQDDGNAPWASTLIDVLAARNDPRTARIIVHHLAMHGRADVRVAAARALGQLKYAGAVLALMRALRDDDPDVRAAAALSLTRVTDQNLGQDAAAWQTWWLRTRGK